MISVYDLPSYCTQLDVAISNNSLIMKKRVELRGRLLKCKSKTKRNKLLEEYRNVKSQCLGLMYGRTCIVPDKFASGSRVIYPSNLTIQKQNAFDLKKAEQIAISYLIKKGRLKETCCGDCFVVESEQKE